MPTCEVTILVLPHCNENTIENVLLRAADHYRALRLEREAKNPRELTPAMQIIFDNLTELE